MIVIPTVARAMLGVWALADDPNSGTAAISAQAVAAPNDRTATVDAGKLCDSKAMGLGRS